ncbi:PREDICTED: uncharacterized protein LOC105146206 [Acromyrmex echinatior]|uniref:uncharacterized protein LOC105146206 n=1 Tax=Acromyrmex echinatior TaxID=103372 RepID=UPI0005810572|nr:PREDICTED: uncharacterized protein LOC105146206 [Acromyrmex echinatior]
MKTGEEETEVDVGTDELVDAAPVVESPCHCEELATISRGLLRYAPGCKGLPRDGGGSGSGNTAYTASRGCRPKTRGSIVSSVPSFEFRKWCVRQLSANYDEFIIYCKTLSAFSITLSKHLKDHKSDA